MTLLQQADSLLLLLLDAAFSGSMPGLTCSLQLLSMSGSGSCSGLNSSSHGCCLNSRSKGSSLGSNLTLLRFGVPLSRTFGAMQRRQCALGIL